METGGCGGLRPRYVIAISVRVKARFRGGVRARVLLEEGVCIPAKERK